MFNQLTQIDLLRDAKNFYTGCKNVGNKIQYEEV